MCSQAALLTAAWACPKLLRWIRAPNAAPPSCTEAVCTPAYLAPGQLGAHLESAHPSAGPPRSAGCSCCPPRGAPSTASHAGVGQGRMMQRPRSTAGDTNAGPLVKSREDCLAHTLTCLQLPLHPIEHVGTGQQHKVAKLVALGPQALHSARQLACGIMRELAATPSPPVRAAMVLHSPIDAAMHVWRRQRHNYPPGW